MATIVEIKRELNSINKISKITNAMKIIAISKIAKAKKNYLEMVDLMTNIHESVRVLAYHLSTQQLLSNINSNRPTLWILFTSSLGMAGSFNGAILKAFITNYKPGERIIVIGDKGYKFLVRNRLEKYIIKHLNLSNRPTDFFQFKMIGEYIYRMYAKKAIGNVKIQFTHFKSSTSSAPVISQIVPVDVNAIKNSVSNNEKHVALGTFTVDPNAESASRKILTLYLEFSLYAAYIESTLCEHLSRKNAMIEASLNEDIKTTELRMQYNKKRQEKITQEVARLSLSL